MNIRTLLAVSLLVNGVLLGAAAYLWKQNARPVPPQAVAASISNAGTVTERARRTTVPLLESTNKSAQPFDWRRMESEDYRQYIENLRAIGCPEKTIRDIIAADVNELFAARSRERGASTNRFEYWKPGNPLANLFNEERVAREQELSREKRELLRTLLGDNAPTGLETSTLMDSSQEILSQMLDFLPSDKVTSVMELEQKYAAKVMNAMQEAQKGDATAMRKTLAEKDKEMLDLLAPAEKFEYELRMSQTAMVLRMQMGGFEPTEKEFRDMFKAKKAFDDEFGFAGIGLANLSDEERARRAAAQKELDATLKGLLGEERHRLYTYEQRWVSDPLSGVVRQFDVPKATAFKVFDLQKDAQARAARVRTDQNLVTEQRTAALMAVRAETERAVTQLLGAEASQAYLKKAGWLRSLGR